MPSRRILACAVAVGVLGQPVVVLAGTFDYSLYGGVEHSNNIALSSDAPASSNVLIPGANFTYLQQGSVFQANVLGTIEYHKYTNSDFDNQTQTQLAGQVNWTVLPDRLDFALEDYAGVQPVDTLSSNAPDNQQQTNVLTLGPTLRLRFSDAMRGQVDLRYINSYASKVDDFNSSRGLVAGRLFRTISPTDEFSLNAEHQRVTFDNGDTGSNYSRDEAFVRYTSTLAHFDADVLVGWTHLDFDRGPSAASKPLARLSLGWTPSTHTSFNLSGAYQYADAAQDLSQPLGQQTIDELVPTGVGTGSGIATGNVVIDSGVYLERLLEANYRYNGTRFALSVSPLYRRLNYVVDATFDQTGRGGSVRWDYRPRPTVTLSVFGTGERLQYDRLARTDKTWRYGADIRQQMTPHWSWTASLIRQTRQSNAAQQSYRETEVFFSVVYRR